MKNDDPIIGMQLANFHVERLLGRGGMARVYLGHDVKLDRPVAIKIVDTRYWGEEEYALRFVDEARLIATWRHENIVQVYYADDQDSLFYFVMEYVDGQDLADILAERLERGQLLPHAEILRIGWAIAHGLDYAHRKGVVHRDIKPSNVLVAADGRVVLSDFGLALDQKRGSQGQAFGTPHYISPEQARRSSDAVPASDLYSFAVILFEMLTGVIPFDDPSSTSIALKHLSEPPPRPSSINPHLNAATDAVLLNALSKQPDERYPTSLALMRALESALQQQTLVNGEAALPPPPVLAAPTTAKPAEKRISLAERSAQLAAERAPLSVTQPGVRKRHEKSVRLVLLGLLLLLGMGMVGGVWYARERGNFPAVLALLPASPQLDTATAIPSPTVNLQPSQTPTPTPKTGGTPATLSTSSATPTTTATSSPTRTLRHATATMTRNTPTRTRSVTSQITPSASGTPEPASPVPSTQALTTTPLLAAPEATPTPSDTPTLSALLSPTPSSYFILFYDYNSFYLLNKSGAPVEYIPFAFERLDSYGETVNRFEGQEWAKYAQRLPDRWCSRLEILQAEPYLEPWQCFNLFGAARNPPRTSEWIFWTKKSGSEEFRVLWHKQEVARCAIKDGTCEFWLPEP